jgi:hypothetical protein
MPLRNLGWLYPVVSFCRTIVAYRVLSLLVGFHMSNPI